MVFRGVSKAAGEVVGATKSAIQHGKRVLVQGRSISYHPAATDTAALLVEKAAKQSLKLLPKLPSVSRGVTVGQTARSFTASLESQLPRQAMATARRTQSLRSMLLPQPSSSEAGRSMSKAFDVAIEGFMRAPSSSAVWEGLAETLEETLHTDELGLLEEERLRVEQNTANHVPEHVEQEAEKNVARIKEKLETELGVELILRSQAALELDPSEIQVREAAIQAAAATLPPLPTHGALSADERPEDARRGLSAEDLETRSQIQRQRTEFERTFDSMATPTERDAFLFGAAGCLTNLSYDQLVHVAGRLRAIGDHETVVALRTSLLDNLDVPQLSTEARNHSIRFLNDPYQKTMAAQAMMTSLFRNPRAAQALLQTVTEQEHYDVKARAEATAQLAAAQALQATAGLRILHGENHELAVRDFERCWGRPPDSLQKDEVAELLGKAAETYEDAFILSGGRRSNYLALAARASLNLANVLEGEDVARAKEVLRQSQVLSAQGVLTGMQEAALASTDISKVRGMYEAALLFTAYPLSDPLPGEAKLYDYAQRILPDLERWLAELHLPRFNEILPKDSGVTKAHKERWNQYQLEGTARRVGATAYSLAVLSDTLQRAAQGPASRGLRRLQEALDEVYSHPVEARERLERLAGRSQLLGLQGRSAAETSMRYVGSMETGGLIASSIVDDAELEWRQRLIADQPIREFAKGPDYQAFLDVCDRYQLDLGKPLNQIVSRPLSHEGYLQTVIDLVSTLAHDHYKIDRKGLESLHDPLHQEWEISQQVRESLAGIGFPEMDAQERRQARTETGGAPTNVSASWMAADGDCRYTNFAAAQLMQELLDQKRQNNAVEFMRLEQQRENGELKAAQLEVQEDQFNQLLDYSEDLVLTTEVRVHADLDIDKMWDQPPEEGGYPKQGHGLTAVEDHTLTLIRDGKKGTLKLGDGFYHNAYAFNRGELIPLTEAEKRDKGLDPDQDYWFAGTKTVMGRDGRPTESPVVLSLAPYAPPLTRSGTRLPRAHERGVSFLGLRTATEAASSGGSAQPTEDSHEL